MFDSDWSSAVSGAKVVVWISRTVFGADMTICAAFSAIALNNGLPGVNNCAVTMQVGQLQPGVLKTPSELGTIFRAVVRNLSPTHSVWYSTLH